MRALILVAATGLLLSGAAYAQDPTATATCKDGSSWSGVRRGGACRGHGGVQAFGSTTVANPMTSATAPATSAPATPTTPAVPAMAPAATAAAPGGGTGQVWVNASTKVYHCPGDRYYGKTKHGSYMTESAAKAAGDHAAGGKACTA